jgi:hypothetical protein
MCVYEYTKKYTISTVYKPEVSKKTNCSVVGFLWKILPVVPVDKMIYYSVSLM